MKTALILIAFLLCTSCNDDNDPPCEYCSPKDGDTAKIVISEVPVKGTWNLPIKGFVQNVNSCDYKIITFIHVVRDDSADLGWWPKPTYANPVSKINSTCQFTINFANDGFDNLADTINVYLVPKEFDISIIQKIPIGDSVTIDAMDSVRSNSISLYQIVR